MNAPFRRQKQARPSGSQIGCTVKRIAHLLVHLFTRQFNAGGAQLRVGRGLQDDSSIAKKSTEGNTPVMNIQRQFAGPTPRNR
jgi:hypothetical protein